MRLRTEAASRTTCDSSLDLMRDEFCQALMEALYELDVLPHDHDGALIGMYAVMDDLEAAIRRIQALDLAGSA